MGGRKTTELVKVLRLVRLEYWNLCEILRLWFHLLYIDGYKSSDNSKEI